MRNLLILAAVINLTACGLPADGPSNSNIRNSYYPHSKNRIPIIELKNAPTVAVNVPVSHGSTIGGLRSLPQGQISNQLRPGDVIEVNVFDSGEEGLFASTNAKTLNMGRFTVDRNGTVTLPFVGKKRVIDSTPEGLQRNIAEGLRGSTVNPQVVVTVVESPSSAVTVNGSVRSPGQFPLLAGRERLLDVLAQSGGATVKDIDVTVVRGSHRARTPLKQLMTDNSQNIHLQPGDQVLLGADGGRFTALGAFKSAGEFDFEPGKMTLAQAVARAGGLLDDRADARNLYLFRANGNQHMIRPAGKTANAAKRPTIASGAVIYHINLREVSNFMLMQQFYLQDGDMLFATNAPLANVGKLLTVFQKGVPTPAAPAPSIPGMK